jgi:hypothetical protein
MPPLPVPSPPSLARDLPTSVPLPAAVPRGSGVYQGGTYGQPSTPGATSLAGTGGMVPRQRPAGTVYGGQTGRPTSANSDAPIEMSGSLTGLILSRGSSQQQRKKERRARLRTALFITIGAVVFIAAIAVTVAVLAGDFIRAIYNALVG